MTRNIEALARTLLGTALLCTLAACSDDSPNGAEAFVAPAMVLIPAGEFQMGDSFGEGYANELPVHTVNLDAYSIGIYEVMNAEYKPFVEADGYADESYWAAGGFGDYGETPVYWDNVQYQGGGLQGTGSFPVVGVSWHEAMAYCVWLSAQTGQTWRLPTEAEWEKAARGTSANRYSWGDNIDGEHANYMNSGGPWNTLAPVGFYNGNAGEAYATRSNASSFGVYDLNGNVIEWTADIFDENYYANSPTSNPTGPETGRYRVMRGGGWDEETIYLRNAFRYNEDVMFRRFCYGFRVVLEM
jgi:formylglycine-generating enzyme required for sulfatase activity